MVNDKEFVICDAVRTPFGHGNNLKDIMPEVLLAETFRALLERNGLTGGEISGTVAGCINQNTRAPNIARIAGMIAGLPEKVNGFSIQANCNSGFTGLCTVLGLMAVGEGDLYLSGGVENMSAYGYRLEDETGMYGDRSELEELIGRGNGEFLRNFRLVNCLEEGLTDGYNNVSMIEIGEIMANRFGISREEQDQYTAEKLKQAVKAVEEGLLGDYIIPAGGIEKDSYPLNRRRMLKNPNSFSRAVPVFGGDREEEAIAGFTEKHRRHLERLGVEKIIPSVTMYNSCIPGNGAGACLVARAKKAEELGLRPKARLIGWAMAGVDPVIMGTGPVESTYKLLQQPSTPQAEGVGFEDIDIIEIHEAFAAQVLSVFKESERRHGMRWNREIINTCGGSLAYTHPLGATNHRLLTNILSRFDKDPSARYALAAGCAGGGQGTSMLFERY